jgi:hypothetical protein
MVRFYGNGGPSTGSPADRLDSWKEIATYLRRDVSTLHRWEKIEGLPVHRHQHKKGSSVYAYRFELDAWWAARDVETRSRHTLSLKRLFLAALACLILVAWIWWLLSA